MSYSTDAARRSAFAVQDTPDTHDRFVAIALVLAFVLVFVGLISSAHPRPDLPTDEAVATFVGP